MNILVLNCGSSSIKYQIIDSSSESILLQGAAEKVTDHASELRSLATKLKAQSVDLIGHRVVHGGEFFSSPCFVDENVCAKIEELIPLAPLHNPFGLAGIKQMGQEFPDVPQVAVFDTNFHSGLPRRAKFYALDIDFAQKNKIMRYGFHGPSHQFVSQLVSTQLNLPLADLKIISLHLGNGASACAIEYGKSVDTSMGMTPLEGLVMGTRSGDIDAGAILNLLQQSNMTAKELDHRLNKASGLRGISGISNDLRDIEDQAEQGHDRARLAINIFSHRARKYIGAYSAVMGGVDAVVFTGGIGANSSTMRRRILQRLDFLGLSLDEDKNSDVQLDHSNNIKEISGTNSRVKVFAAKTNEELMIAREARRVFDKNKNKKALKIPIAVSARHLHLTKETFEQLFGAGKEPTKYKDISQPGQYACNEKVDLIGPRGTIEGVRLLGPLRPKNQIEISRTDEFKLGVDAPIRDSGKVRGSAPIKVRGPETTIELTEGLICARRHIHMHPDDAKAFNVEDKDVVRVAITGGDRDLIFGDVLVRVSEKYKLEMHIDTDEANACEITPESNRGDIIYESISSREGQLEF